MRRVGCESGRVMSGSPLSQLPTVRLNLAQLVSKGRSPSGCRRAIAFALEA